MYRRLFLSVSCAVLLWGAALPQNVHAASAVKEKGLLIMPIRQYLSGTAGTTVASTFQIANLTSSPFSVNLSVKQFSVTELAYNYQFSPPKDNWVHLASTAASLSPSETRTIHYTISIPHSSPPGGVYYTLFASATLTTGGVKSTIQATDLLYLTVNGHLVKTSRIVRSHVPWLSLGNSIAYTVQAVNTGNVYFFAYPSGAVRGWLTKPAGTSTAHLLMPGKTRAIGASIPAPLLPGIYRATIGYTTDTGQTIATNRWLVFIPPWFIAFGLAALLAGGSIIRKRRRKHSKPEDTAPSNR